MHQHLLTIKIIDDQTGSELWTDQVDLTAVLAFKGEGSLFQSDLAPVKVEKDKNTEIKRSEKQDNGETQEAVNNPE